jgi:hypothetical protein
MPHDLRGLQTFRILFQQLLLIPDESRQFHFPLLFLFDECLRIDGLIEMYGDFPLFHVSANRFPFLFFLKFDHARFVPVFLQIFLSVLLYFLDVVGVLAVDRVGAFHSLSMQMFSGLLEIFP